MKSDMLFYRLFQEFPHLFFELIGKEGREADIYTFASVEMKQVAFRVDGLFVPHQGGSEHPLYFVEVQFQKDPRLYARLCGEVFLYLSQHEGEMDWRGVVIYPNRQVESEVPAAYRELVESGRIRRIYLEEIGEEGNRSVGLGVVRLVVEPEETALAMAQRLIARTQTEMLAPLEQRAMVELIEQIIVYKFPTKSREEVERMLGLSDLKSTRVYREAREEGLQEGLQEGRYKGLQEGLHKGLQKGLLARIELGLELKFGIEGLKLMEEIRGIEEEDRLWAIYDGLRSVTTLEEVRHLYGEIG